MACIFHDKPCVFSSVGKRDFYFALSAMPEHEKTLKNRICFAAFGMGRL